MWNIHTPWILVGQYPHVPLDEFACADYLRVQRADDVFGIHLEHRVSFGSAIRHRLDEGVWQIFFRMLRAKENTADRRMDFLPIIHGEQFHFQQKIHVV